MTARRELARLIRRFYAGHLTNWEFEDAFKKLPDDPVLSEVFWHGPWTTYSDFPEYRFPDRHILGKESRRVIACWILFLHRGPAHTSSLSCQKSWWMGLSVPAVLLLGALVTLFTQRWQWMIAGPLVLIVIGKVRALFQERRVFNSEPFAWWPFVSDQDVAAAREHPFFLTGKESSASWTNFSN